MITVQILINGQVIFARSARNVGATAHKDIYVYHVDDGRVVLHNRNDRAVALARRILEDVEEP